MKKLIYLSICLFILNCKETEIEPTYQSEAIISGYDFSMCACCGGWKIKANNTNYLINKMPSDFVETLGKTTFPLREHINLNIPTLTWRNFPKVLNFREVERK